MTDTNNIEILKIREAVTRAKSMGINISEYTVRRAVRSGQLPCRIVGRTYMITLTNLVEWITCANGSDNEVTSDKK